MRNEICFAAICNDSYCRISETNLDLNNSGIIKMNNTLQFSYYLQIIKFDDSFVHIVILEN